VGTKNAVGRFAGSRTAARIHSPSTARAFFVDRPAVYAKALLRVPQAPGGFAPPVEHVVTPSAQRPRFRGPVAVLSGPACTSSCEAFLLMRRAPPRRLLFGERSYGSSGNPRPIDLCNGVVVTLPSWQALRADGTPLEGRGIEPDVEVPFTGGASDPVLSAALDWLTRARPGA
jgi:Peptidase family S41